MSSLPILGNGQQLPEGSHVIFSNASGGGIPYTGHPHTGPMTGFRTGNGIFHHEAVFCGQAKHLGCFYEHFGIRLGMGNVVAVGYGIEKAFQSQPLQNHRCILGGRSDGKQ